MMETVYTGGVRVGLQVFGSVGTLYTYVKIKLWLLHGSVISRR